MPVEALARDLERARTALQPNVFKITGGEPLLHPDIVGCLDAVRRSEIADSIQVTTNGHLIKRAPAAFWEHIDRLAVSYYTSAPLANSLREYIEAKTEEYGVELNVKHRDAFQVMDADDPPQDAETTREVYRDCWLKVRCHMIYRGRFYKCTRPPHLRDRLADRDVELDLEGDGVDLDGPRLAHRIREYLEADEPLDSCRYCRGTSGEMEAHSQVCG